jgi:hypothetical protein
MSTYPVHYTVSKPERFSRLQLVVRLVASAALGLLGLSLGALYLVAYLALPAYAAARLGRVSGATYLREDGPRLVRGLAWASAIYAWFALVTDGLPARVPDEQLRIGVEPVGAPTAASALWRVVVGVPSALALAVLGFLGGLVWLWSALRVLLFEQVGDGAHAYLAGVQRWSLRLLAYQASLVDVYPPFSFDDDPVTLPEAAGTGRVAP